MTLYRVHMTLARNDEYPNGSPAHGYDAVLPLDSEMRLDPEAWRQHSKECAVRRFWGDEEDAHGRLRHIGRGWVIDYDEDEVDDNEPFFKLDKHVVRPGEYLSVTEWDGEMRTFYVVTADPLAGS